MGLEGTIAATEIDELEVFLNSDAVSDDALNISSLHGFLTALVVSPSLIPLSQWFPLIWGEEEPTFDSEDQAERVLGLVLRLYGSIAEDLAERPEKFAPILLEKDQAKSPRPDSRGLDIRPEDWCEGFSHGVGLCFEDWDPLIEDDVAGILLAPIIAFSLPESLKKLAEKALFETARAELIALLPQAVRAIYEYWAPERAHIGGSLVQPARVKVGRNDPCPCGSGKKYKRCCGVR